VELSDLGVFEAVVRAVGVTRAALQLHRVQSNVTTRVKQLEEDLGVALLVREGRRMQLTAAGRVLLEYADRLLTLAEEARNAVSDARPRGTLRLGAMESTAAVRLPQPLNRLHRHMPTSPSSCAPAIPQQLTALVLSGGSTPRSSRARHRFAARVAPCLRRGAGARVTGGHPPIGSPRTSRANAARIRAGVSHRQRAEVVARAQVTPDGSSDGLLPDPRLRGRRHGRADAESVLDAYAERAQLGVHALTGRFRSVRTLLIWRRDAPHARVAALAEALEPAEAKRRARRQS
jgi:DNA-binding transcriptional LysR family regulator